MFEINIKCSSTDTIHYQYLSRVIAEAIENMKKDDPGITSKSISSFNPTKSTSQAIQNHQLRRSQDEQCHEGSR